LLAFSRSGEEAAGQSVGLTQIILVWTAALFLLHSVVVYFCLYPQGLSGAKGEAAVFAVASLAALIIVIFALPPDFVRNTVIANLLPDRIERLTKPDNNDWGIPEDRGGRRPGRNTIPNDGSGQQPGLRGLSEHDWPGEGRTGSGKGDGERQQYTVMVVASKQEPVYMGDAYRGKFDPVKGFLLTPEEPLNSLPSMRLITTWFDNEPVFDRGRERQEVFALSMLPRNFPPYRPFSVEPTILSEGSGPLRYIHRVTSDVYPGDPLELTLSRIRDLNGAERNALAPYLELPLREDDRAVFAAYLEGALDAWRNNGADYLRNIFSWGDSPGAADNTSEYMERILAILVSFNAYQYNVSNNDDFSIAALTEFLLNTKDGDCVEFSNTAALLGRLAGIPSRVVTGYLAAEGLQTMAHLRGLAALRSRIKALQAFPFDDLYLVTDAHSHSWTQFYVPGYGWLDFEATTFAIPPIGMGDGNLRDVVIPLFDDRQVISQVRAFPWRAVLRAAAFLAAAALVCAYLLRYGREILLHAGSRRGGRAGARSLYLLLLARLAADGKPIKPASKTAAEYADLFPKHEEKKPQSRKRKDDEGYGASSFAAFAALYTELRWRDFADPAEQAGRFHQLEEEYRNIITLTQRRGIKAFVIRLFSLRGLAYL
jgi:transglutaminase-like putative cysteine protease